MKTRKYLSPLIALCVLAGARQAFASNAKTVIITNNTSYTMSELYASACDNTSWDTTNNLVAGQSLAPGQTATITIADGLEACHYDLMAVLYGAAEHAYQYQVNACEGTGWTIH